MAALAVALARIRHPLYEHNAKRVNIYRQSEHIFTSPTLANKLWPLITPRCGSLSTSHDAISSIQYSQRRLKGGNVCSESPSTPSSDSTPWLTDQPSSCSLISLHRARVILRLLLSYVTSTAFRGRGYPVIASQTRIAIVQLGPSKILTCPSSINHHSSS
jgi:hypothetical protein